MSDSTGSDPVAIVTGGASGIGAAVAARLRATGHRVVVLDIAPPHDVACDVSDPASVDPAIAAAVRLAGPPDRVVACAGVGYSGLLLHDPPEEFHRVLDVNLFGTWLVLRSA